MPKWKRRNGRPSPAPPSLNSSANALRHEGHRQIGTAASGTICEALTPGGTELSHQEAQRDLTCHMPRLLGKHACLYGSILYVASDSESSLSNFLLLTWTDCGRRWLKKARAAQRSFGLRGRKKQNQTTPFATNELLSASIRHDINMIVPLYKSEDNRHTVP